MKRKTKFCILIGIVICIVITSLLVACDKNIETKTQTVLYKSANVEVIQTEDTQEITYVFYEWINLSDKEAYTKNTVLLTGEISNIRYATVSYRFMDCNVIDNMTLFDVKVDKVLACNSDLFPNREFITVGVGYNTNNYSEDLPEISEGNQYLIFCYVAADIENDVRETSQYVDCWIGYPKDLLCERIDGYYLVGDFFSDIPKAINLADSTGITEKDVETIMTFDQDDDLGIRNLIKNTMDKSSIKSFFNNDVAVSSVLRLKERLSNNPNSLWQLINRYYLVEKTVFENYVRVIAESFID